MKIDTNIQIKVDASDFETCDLANVDQVPRIPGVYLVHAGELAQAWEEAGVIYIGATAREGLSVRAGKHRSVLLGEVNANGAPKVPGAKAMKAVGQRLQHNIRHLRFSWMACGLDQSRQLPFVIESALEDMYERKHGIRPEVNKGRR